MMLIDHLTAEDRAEIAEKLAKRVVDRRLEAPAALFLEMHKPVTFLGGQALLVGAPLLGSLFGYENMQRIALFFQSPENVEVLLQRLEEMSRERDSRGVESDGVAPEGS